MGKLADVAARDAGRRPIELHAQPFGQRPVVQVLAMPGPVVGDPADAIGDDHRRKRHQQQDPVGHEVRVRHVRQAGHQRAAVRHAQHGHHPLLEVNREPVRRAEHLVDVAQPRRQACRLLVVQQRIGTGSDLARVLVRVGTEFVGAREHLAMSQRHVACAGFSRVGRIPAGLERPQAGCRAAFRAVARAGDVVDEVAFVVRERQAPGGGRRRITGHHVVMVETHDLARPPELVRHLAVPEREQDVAVCAQEDAGLRILPCASGPLLADQCNRVARHQRQLVHLDGGGAQRVEMRDGFPRREVADVQVARHRQRHVQRQAQRDRLLGDDAVGTFGERRHDRDDAPGVRVAQAAQEAPHHAADRRNLRRQQVAVTGHGDDERHAIALSGTGRGAAGAGAACRVECAGAGHASGRLADRRPGRIADRACRVSNCRGAASLRHDSSPMLNSLMA